jgi:hypothetical protein
MARGALECPGHGEVPAAAMAALSIVSLLGGASGSGGSTRSKRDCEQEKLDGGGLVAVKFGGDWKSTVAG